MRSVGLSCVGANLTERLGFIIVGVILEIGVHFV
jgi:hypothetical protein